MCQKLLIYQQDNPHYSAQGHNCEIKTYSEDESSFFQESDSSYEQQYEDHTSAELCGVLEIQELKMNNDNHQQQVAEEKSNDSYDVSNMPSLIDDPFPAFTESVTILSGSELNCSYLHFIEQMQDDVHYDTGFSTEEESSSSQNSDTTVNAVIKNKEEGISVLTSSFDGALLKRDFITIWSWIMIKCEDVSAEDRDEYHKSVDQLHPYIWHELVRDNKFISLCLRQPEVAKKVGYKVIDISNYEPTSIDGNMFINNIKNKSMLWNGRSMFDSCEFHYLSRFGFFVDYETISFIANKRFIEIFINNIKNKFMLWNKRSIFESWKYYLNRSNFILNLITDKVEMEESEESFKMDIIQMKRVLKRVYK